MKFRILYKIFALGFLAFVFQSRSSGPANIAGLQVTSAPGSTGNMGTCANSGCHTSGQFDPALSIELLNDGTPVDKYEPGESYTLRITLSNGSGNPGGFGFQATSRTSDNSTGGTLQAGNDQHITEVAQKQYLEHDFMASDGVFESTWVAPTANTGTITFYSAGIAANGTGSTAGDGVASSSLEITEDGGNSTFSNERDYATISIVPNPVSDQLKLAITSRGAGNFEIRIADASGKIVRTNSVFLSSGENEKSFSVGDLVKGYYSVQLCGENHVTSVQMLKL